jgi:cell division septation protein DedD
LSQDTAPLNDDAFHEIQLSGKQLVFLFMATTVVSVFIFLCGVLVGRGVRAEKALDAVEQTAAAAPLSDAPPAAQAGPVTDEPPPPAEAPESEDLSYHDRLQGEGATREQLKAPAEARQTPSERAAKPPAPVPAAAQSPSASQGGWVVQLIVLRNREEASTIVHRLTSKGYPAFVVEPAPGAAVRAFKVQVGRYSDRREAEQAARRLEKEEQFKPWILR